MFDNISQDLINNNLAVQRAYLNEVSDLDTSLGPVHDSVLYYSALFAAAQQQQIKNLSSVFNVKELIRNAATISAQLVDNIAANWGAARRQGACAKGIVAVVLEKPLTTIIPSAAEFTTDTQTFITQGSYILRTVGGSALSDNDRALVQTDKGWIAYVPVVAKKAGTNGNIRRMTPLKLNKNLSAVKYLYAKDDFTNGSNNETNKQLLDRMVLGVAAKSVNNRTNITALVQSYLPNYSCSIIGVNDKEYESGFVDVYLAPKSHIISRTATLTTKTPGIFTIPAEYANGIYDIGAAYADVAYDIQSINYHNTVFGADQSLTVFIEQEITTCTFSLLGIDDLTALNNAIADNPACNIRLRAAIPCPTTIYVIAKGKYAANTKERIADYINNQRFVSSIRASDVEAATGNKNLSVVLSGLITKANDIELLPSTSGKELIIPEILDKGISPNTVAIYCDPTNIVISEE
jgi:uncharacterized phage protein gp47/JayE